MVTSYDGYIRLTYSCLLGLQFKHSISGLDNDARLVKGHGTVISAICGYTEWMTDPPPIVVLGWDWCLNPFTQSIIRVRDTYPRSNMMLQDRQYRDLGPIATETILKHAIDNELDWRVETLNAIAKRYA